MKNSTRRNPRPLSAALAALLVVLTVFATACTSPAPAPAAPAPAAPAAPTVAQPEKAAAAPVSEIVNASQAATIDWQQFKGVTPNAHMCKHWWTDALIPLMPEFEALTGMKVKLDTYSEDTYFQRVVTELSSNSSAHDVMMVGNVFVGQYMAGGWLEPLDGYINNPKLTDLAWYDLEDLLPSGRGAGAKDGKQFALPIGAEGEMLFYRKDIFEAKGIKPPTTYTELYAIAKQLNSPEMAGYVARGKRGLDVVWEWTGFLLSHGGRYFDDQGKPAFNSPEGVAATDMYVKLLKDAGPEGTINWSWMEASQNFGQGKSAMFVEAGGIGPVVEKEGNPARGKVEYVVLPHAEGKPTIPNYHFWMIGIPNGSKQKDAAWLFINWATSKVVGPHLYKGGSSPARASVWNSPDITTWADPGWAKTSLETLRLVQPDLVPYNRADFPEIVDAISTEINNIQSSGKDVQAALDDAAAKVAKIIGK